MVYPGMELPYLFLGGTTPLPTLQSWFPPPLLRHAHHPAVEALGPEPRLELGRRCFVRAIVSMVQLEAEVVARAARDAAQSNLGVPVSVEQREGALRLIRDKAVLAGQAEALLASAGATLPVPGFEDAPVMMGEPADGRQQDWLNLLNAVVLQTALPTRLMALAETLRWHPTLWDDVTVHAVRQGHHAAFLGGLLVECWPRAAPLLKRDLAGWVPSLLRAHLGPELLALHGDLLAVGLSGPEAAVVLDESFRPEDVRALVRRGGRETLDWLHRAGVLELAGEKLKMLGYW